MLIVLYPIGAHFPAWSSIYSTGPGLRPYQMLDTRDFDNPTVIYMGIFRLFLGAFALYMSTTEWLRLI